MAVTKRTRFEVLRRDGHRCRYCGAAATDGATLTIDHVTPQALGGTDDPSNLVAACSDCNSGKTSTRPDDQTVADVSSGAIRWARAMQVAIERAQEDRDVELEALSKFEESWNTWRYADQHTVPLLPNWRQSVMSIIASGLTLGELIDLIPAAMDHRVNDPFRYLCGCAWRRIEQRRQDAARLLAEEDRLAELRAERDRQDAERQAARGPIVGPPRSFREMVNEARRRGQVS